MTAMQGRVDRLTCQLQHTGRGWRAACKKKGNGLDATLEHWAGTGSCCQRYDVLYATFCQAAEAV
jgi:hypothetical protein